MTTSDKAIQETMQRIWQEFTATDKAISEEVRPIILDSWKRCRKYGVSPLQTKVAEVLTLRDLEEIRLENREIINVALPIMEKILGFVAGSGFIVSFADKDGYLLEVIGDQEILQASQRGNYLPGANWSERSAGTNSIGTCIVTKQPLQIFAYEHFCKCSHRWTCSSAPVRHSLDNKVIGVLTMTGKYEFVHSHTLGMVYAAVHAIENELALRNAWLCCEVANNQKAKIIDAISEGIIAVDHQGIITQVNKICCQLFGFSESRALYQDIHNVLGPQNHAVHAVLSQNSEVTDQHITVYNLFNNQKLQCTVTSRFIELNNDDTKSKVLLFSEVKRTRKLLQQFLGNQARFTFEDLIGSHPKFIRSIELAKSAAKSFSNVLLLGESGTGKEMFAQAIHNSSSRSSGPFLAINCSGIPRDLIGSELFGYAEGAFTGAKKGGNPGKFELAEGGTLFLDEIGDMPLELQSVLLRVLEEKRIMRIGSGDSMLIDVRIISATNRNLWQEVKKGNFRDDLFYRLNVLTVDMVPLRERKEDIMGLTRYFLDSFASQQQKVIYEIHPEVMELLKSYDWPGNVRQLQNVIERIVNITKTETLFPEVVPEEIKNGTVRIPQASLNFQHSEEKIQLEELLAKHEGNLSSVAKEMNIARSTLYRRLRKHNLI